MPESPIRKLVPYSEQALKKGLEVFHLNIGQPDIETPKIALRAIKNNKLKVLEYSHSAGFESYRKGLCWYYERNNISVDIEDIIVTTGGSEALSFALNSVCDPGDEIIIPEPFYANYNGFAIAAGLKVRAVSSDIKSGFSLPPINSFEKLINENTKAIMICNPGNPTGYLYTEDELHQLKDLCLKHDIFLIADEVYREFCYDGAQHHSILNLIELQDHAIVIDSVSKRYSMCGARIGCIISRNKGVMSTALKYAQSRLSPPTLAQIASEAALKTGPEYFFEVNEEYKKRRDVLVEGLNAIEGVFCPKPRGAFYAVAELPVDDTEKFAQWMLSEFELDGATLMVAPAAGFYSTPGKGTKEIRLAYVLNIEDLKRSIEILKVALATYNSKEAK